MSRVEVCTLALIVLVACTPKDTVAPPKQSNGSSTSTQAVDAPSQGNAATAAGRAAMTAARAAPSAGGSVSKDTGVAGRSMAATTVAAGAPAVSAADAGAAANSEIDAGRSTMAGSSEDASASSDGAATTEVSGGAKDPECDMTGIWFAQLVTVNEALFMPQYGNSYFYYELKQSGEQFEVIKSMNCGIAVQGSANVSLSVATTKALMPVSSQVGRKGTMKLDGSSCAFELERFWGLRGATDQFMPTPRTDPATLEQVQAKMPLPTRDKPDGAIDVDGDGLLGITFNISGIVTGKRSSIQRDWNYFVSSADYSVTPALDWPELITVKGQFENEESVLATDPADDLTLASGAAPNVNDPDNRLILKFLGRSASDPNVTAMVVGDDPVADPEAAYMTCMNLQNAMPVQMKRP